MLDLRAVDFDKRDTDLTVAVNFGEATVVVPPNVDVTAVTNVKAGEATVFGRRTSGMEGQGRQVTDLGPGRGRRRHAAAHRPRQRRAIWR